MEDAQDGRTAGAANGASQPPRALQPRVAATAPKQQRQLQQQQQPKPAKPAGRRVAFQSPAGDEGEAGNAATPQAPPRAGSEAPSEGGGTPYDDVLAMLRQGPLAAASPRSFPRPRSSSLLTAGAGRTPGPGLAFGGGASITPSPAPPSAGSELRTARSRLGPGGLSATPSTGMRSTYTARSNSRFSRTPVHMQPLAAGVQGGSGGAGGGAGAATSRFGLAAAAAAAGAGVAASGSGAAGLLSPAPLAWTPMRSNQATALRGAPAGGPASGAKRKAESASPDAGAWAAFGPAAAGAGGGRSAGTACCSSFVQPADAGFTPQPQPLTAPCCPCEQTVAPLETSACLMRSAASASGRSRQPLRRAAAATSARGARAARRSTSPAPVCHALAQLWRPPRSAAPAQQA